MRSLPPPVPRGSSCISRAPAISGTSRLRTAAAAFAVGALVALQSRINAQLADEVGSGVTAATISFGTGLLLALVIAAAVPRVRRGLRRIPGALRAGSLRGWQLLGGMGGAWLVTTQGLVVGVVGVTVFIVGVVAGQVAGSLAVDRLGLSPAGRLPVSSQRGIAAVLAVVAVAASGWGSFDTAGRGAAVAVAIAASAGLGISVQQAINARVSAAADDAVAAATVNFTVGFTVLSGALLAGWMLGGIAVATFPTNPGLYVGGPIGLLFIALAAWAVRGLGVLAFGLLSIAGQLAGALILDVAAPAADTAFGFAGVLGLILVAAAVWLAGRGTALPRSATLKR